MMRTFALYGSFFVIIVGALLFFTVSLDDINAYRPHKAPQESQPHKSPQDSQSELYSSAPTENKSWTFDYKRHGRNYGLTEEQCDIAFPDLYKEIDRAVQHRKSKWGNITPDEVEVAWRGDGIVRAMIHDNQLYIIDPHAVWDHNHRPRTLATLHSIHRAVTAYQGILPDIEFSFVVHDSALLDSRGNHTTWAYSRLAHQKKLWLMPDFGLWGWPDVGLRSFAELQQILDHEEVDYTEKIPQIVWRGSVDVGSKDVRAGLVKHSKGKAWSDVQVLDWSNKSNIEERILTMQDHCSYMFTAQTEGNTYSGRLKCLLNCRSVLFSHELEWIELYHHLMKSSGPDQNYIKVRRDYRDLPGHMSKFTTPSNYADAQKIADNARRTFRERYLTPAAEACYWRAMFRAWASVMDFKPEFWVEVMEWDKVSKKEKLKRKPRGAPFESYAIMEEIEWDIPAKPRRICIAE